MPREALRLVIIKMPMENGTDQMDNLHLMQKLVFLNLLQVLQTGYMVIRYQIRKLIMVML
jgi:hypothetical protein